MKTFMLRGNEKESYADPEDCPKSLKYGVWYEMVTPFNWFYVKLKKNNKYVALYTIKPGDPKYIKHIVSKKDFREKWVTLVKSPIREYTK